jgi:hypothetical protein
MQDVIFPTRVTHTRVTLEGEPRWTQRSNKPSGKPGHGQLRSLRARSNRAPLRSNALRRVVGALPLSSWWESARGTTRPPVHIPPIQPSPSRLFLSALAAASPPVPNAHPPFPIPPPPAARPVINYPHDTPPAAAAAPDRCPSLPRRAA